MTRLDELLRFYSILTFYVHYERLSFLTLQSINTIEPFKALQEFTKKIPQLFKQFNFCFIRSGDISPKSLVSEETKLEQFGHKLTIVVFV